MYRIFSIITLFIATLIWLQPVQAQTCRVNVGSPQSRSKGYIEVYEYDFVTDKPCFPGGDALLMSWINEHRTYPSDAYKKGIQGKVICSFVVNVDGSISHIKVLRGVEPSLNKEAMRVIRKMPLWTPGRHGGCAVPVRVVRSIAFRR